MRQLLIASFLLFTLACDDTTVINLPADPTPTNKVDSIEFRVIGNAQTVRVRHSNSQDGLNQLNTTLPFFIQLNNTRTSIFLSLEVTPLSFPFSVTQPFVSAQIIVNGDLFREASSSDFLSNTLFVSGTYRR